jgi:hypothetical protein
MRTGGCRKGFTAAARRRGGAEGDCFHGALHLGCAGNKLKKCERDGQMRQGFVLVWVSTIA